MRASSARGRNDPAGARNQSHGSALLCCARRAAQNRATMLRLPRAAHYSICDLLCARELARLSKTASQWSRADDPRHAAFFACLADRVARARAVIAARRHGTTDDGSSDDEQLGYVVPGKTIASTLKFLEAVERRDWKITPTGRDGDCSGQLRKILRSYTTSFSGGFKDGDDIVFLAGQEYRFVHIVKLHFLEKGKKRVPQITFRGVGGPSKPLLYADADTLFCLFHIRGPSINNEPNPIIQFSGLAFRNDSRAGRRNSIVCSRYPNMNILRINDCHVWTIRSSYWRQVAGGHPVLEPLQCAKMEVCSARRLWLPINWSLTDSESSSSSSEDY